MARLSPGGRLPDSCASVRQEVGLSLRKGVFDRRDYPRQELVMEP